MLKFVDLFAVGHASGAGWRCASVAGEEISALLAGLLCRLIYSRPLLSLSPVYALACRIGALVQVAREIGSRAARALTGARLSFP